MATYLPSHALSYTGSYIKMIYCAFLFSVMLLQESQDNIRCENGAMNWDDHPAVSKVRFSN